MAAMLPAGCDLRLPTVLLRHEMPDGSEHVDWMIARDDDGRQPLVSFRLHDRLDELEDGDSLAAEHIGEHRSDYLHYQGRVSGGRGHVTRLTRGHVLECQHAGGDDMDLTIRWEQRQQRLRLLQEDSEHWQVFSLAMTGSNR